MLEAFPGGRELSSIVFIFCGAQALIDCTPDFSRVLEASGSFCEVLISESFIFLALAQCSPDILDWLTKGPRNNQNEVTNEYRPIHFNIYT